MGIAEILALGVGLSMDAFAVSVCKGLTGTDSKVRTMATCGLWFGGFQAIMPLVGFFAGSFFAATIAAYDHWIAFGLLAAIGVNMLREALTGDEGDCEKEKHSGDLSVLTMLTLAVATSIDALAVGISLAIIGGIEIWSTVSLIGATTCIISICGVKMGTIFGDKFEKKAGILGGVILVLLGVKILLEC